MSSTKTEYAIFGTVAARYIRTTNRYDAATVHEAERFESVIAAGAKLAALYSGTVPANQLGRYHEIHAITTTVTESVKPEQRTVLAQGDSPERYDEVKYALRAISNFGRTVFATDAYLDYVEEFDERYSEDLADADLFDTAEEAMNVFWQRAEMSTWVGSPRTTVVTVGVTYGKTQTTTDVSVRVVE